MPGCRSGETGPVKEGRDRERVVSLSAKCASPFDRLTVLSIAEGRTTSAEDQNSLSAVLVEGFVKMWVRELDAPRLEWQEELPGGLQAAVPSR
jgi:hypothetical protein